MTFNEFVEYQQALTSAERDPYWEMPPLPESSRVVHHMDENKNKWKVRWYTEEEMLAYGLLCAGKACIDKTT